MYVLAGTFQIYLYGHPQGFTERRLLLGRSPGIEELNKMLRIITGGGRQVFTMVCAWYDPELFRLASSGELVESSRACYFPFAVN